MLSSDDKTGWSDLEKKLEMINSFLKVKPVKGFTDEHGLLKLEYEQINDPALQEIVNIISWYFERQAAKICQQCGALGYRRKVFPENPTLCQRCYIFEYNKRYDSKE